MQVHKIVKNNEITEKDINYKINLWNLKFTYCSINDNKREKKIPLDNFYVS